jgi:hypothetical protein
MRLSVIPVLLVLLSALLLAGCGGDSTAAEPEPPPPTTGPPAPAPPAPPPRPAKPSPTFKKSDLERIALGPKNAPPGLAYLKDESGIMSLDDVGIILPSQTRPLKDIGFQTLHDSIFASRQPRTDHRVAQRIWLFRNRGGASVWLQKTHEDARSLQFNDLQGPQLGDESWVASGLIQIGGGQAITYAFRYGNTVHTVSMYGDVTPPSPKAALAAAKAALKKASRK